MDSETADKGLWDCASYLCARKRRAATFAPFLVIARETAGNATDLRANVPLECARKFMLYRCLRTRSRRHRLS